MTSAVLTVVLQIVTALVALVAIGLAMLEHLRANRAVRRAQRLGERNADLALHLEAARQANRAYLTRSPS
jgi:hypothetical protein